MASRPASFSGNCLGLTIAHGRVAGWIHQIEGSHAILVVREANHQPMEANMTTNPYVPGIAELAYFDPRDADAAGLPNERQRGAIPNLKRDEPAVDRFAKGRSLPSSLWI